MDCAKQPLEQFEAKYPYECRPRICLELCEDWARGRIKMLTAKRAILDSHAVAKEIDDKEYGAFIYSFIFIFTSNHIEFLRLLSKGKTLQSDF
ncbi:MAG TPA: hypothetical protein PK733_18780 [Clostridiales bacterium]|nr:hypothetical protein [Clostridiales bacterium]